MIAACPLIPSTARRWPLDDPSRGSSDAPAATSGTGVSGSASAPGTPPAGLREEIGATRGAATRLVKAHIDLARTEFAEIFDEIKRLAIGVGIAIGVLLFAALLVPVGSILFFGEWLFGSMGWGVLHGVELSIGVAVAAIVAVLGATRGQILGTLLVGLIAGIVVGVALGLDLTNQGWTRLGDSVGAAIEPGVRPLVLAVASVAIAFGILGLLLGARGGGVGGAIAGLIGGVVLGAIVGAFTAIRWGSQAGAGAGVAVGLMVWPAALGTSVWRKGIDWDAIKDKLVPNQTMETTRETIEWVREQMPLVRKS
jgi:hypothetical protein